MARLAVIQESYKNTFNKGAFLGAKIYSDIKGNLCPCGGKYTRKESFKGYEFPSCHKCYENPPKYRINATIINTDGVKKIISIRYDQSGERLSDIVDVLTCLKRINQEIEEGIFDVRRYDSKSNKESFLFQNFAKSYIEHNENKYKRKEITYEGLRDKKNLIKNHLLPYFKGFDINKITLLKLMSLSTATLKS